MKVFLVDDDKLFVFLTKKTILSTRLATGITEFNDGENAIEFIKEHAGKPDELPDVIFLDLSMPIMDGWTFLKEFEAVKDLMSKKIIIYVFTSSISPHDLERAKGIPHVADFLIKPLERDQFVQLLSDKVA